MQKSKFMLVAISILSLGLSACVRDMNSSTYTSSSSGGSVIEGTIVSARPVNIKENSKLTDNGAGLLAGGVGGAAVGSTIGGGSGNTVATVGGALAGAALGALIEDQLGNSEGMEYIVKVKKENTGGKIHKQEYIKNADPDKKASTKTIETDLKTDLVSVVQGKDVIL